MQSTSRDSATSTWPWTSAGQGTTLAAEETEETGLFTYFSNGLSGYVPLRSADRSNEEEAYLSLSHWERFLGFLMCIAGSGVCFLFSFIFLTPPILALKPHKFALAFTLGSILFMVGFAVLSGPMAHFRHLTSPERLPFSIAYISSMIGTLYFALGPQWRLVTFLFAIIQIVALLFYLAAYFPGGVTTLRYAGTLFTRGSSLLPI
ncbi:hypothetical protein MVES1_002461 [Malassezia vespertilionis]|uniref:Protein transport protein SFT2 n=1 Tax=Malassezia vespertilionis TaxID=2020962 RepID=A0A2N1JAU0_9BASI|nr:uncharacterized protein MVES1_002461 [Malassezia vespertilionis]PKI83664.1 Sft2p [Malassezia vespertilionis]WFD07104.1 hypothetical protein MVES1_002461 [Malassezia vespertilionis]